MSNTSEKLAYYRSFEDLDCSNTLPQYHLYENKIPYLLESKCVRGQNVLYTKSKLVYHTFMTTKGRRATFEEHEIVETCKQTPKGDWVCQ